MLSDEQLWALVLEAQREADEADTEYKASIMDAVRGTSGKSFDSGPADKLAMANAKLRRLKAEWDVRTHGKGHHG
jgi:hypothetical protein